MVTLLTWNIQHGGGALRTPWIALALIEARADIIVLTEFRRGRGGQIRAALADHGLCHHAVTPGGPTDNCLLIASRETLVARAEPADGAARRWLEVWLPESGLRIAGVHIPPAPGLERTLVWRRLLAAATRLAGEPFAVLGDFNCGRSGPDGRNFRHTALLGRLATMGYVDAWRALSPGERAVTWRGPDGASARIDHCLLGPPLAGRLEAAWIDHRRARWVDEHGVGGLSDHAPLLVRLDETGRARRYRQHAQAPGEPKNRSKTGP